MEFQLEFHFQLGIPIPIAINLGEYQKNDTVLCKKTMKYV